LLTSNRCDRFALALILIGTGAGCDESASGTGDGGAPIPATVCPWGKDFPTITLPSSEVKGVLKGASRNPSTTCTRSRGTGGPDTAFLLPITARTTVELEVISGFDTVLAIRSACDDPLTELACNDNQGVTGAGGGSGDSRSAGRSRAERFWARADDAHDPRRTGKEGNRRTHIAIASRKRGKKLRRCA